MKKHILSFIFVGALFAPATSKPVVPHQEYSWVAPMIVTAATMYFMWAHWDEVKPFSSLYTDEYLSGRNMGRALCVTEPYDKIIDVTRAGDGHAVSVEQSVLLQQLPVSQQGHHNDGDASCGYHAIKNSIGILSGELGYLTDTQIIADHFSLTPGSWRAGIQAKLAEFGVDGLQADWLSVDAFEGLIKDILPTPNYSLVDAAGKSCTGFDRQWGRDELNRIAHIVAQHAGQEYKHVFFINTACLAELQGNRDTFAHWYVLVMDKKADGSTTYTVMDSLGNERHEDATVLNIIQRMHS